MPKKKMKAWTKEEVDTVRKGYHKFTAKQLADKLKRPEGSVRWKIADLGLRKEERPQDYAIHPSIDSSRRPDFSGTTIDGLGKPSKTQAQVDRDTIYEEHERFDNDEYFRKLAEPKKPWWKFW